MSDTAEKNVLALLTPQERECLKLVGRQLSSKEIGRELGIAKASVDTYCNRARAKLGVTDRRAAAQMVLAAEGSTPSPRVMPATSPNRLNTILGAIPPMEDLRPVRRLAASVAGAVVLALGIGMLLSGLQALNAWAKEAYHLADTTEGQNVASGEPEPHSFGRR